MSFQCRVLACLALGLVFISQNIGIYMLKVSGTPSAEFILVTVIHSIGMLVCALLMPPLLTRGRGFLSPVSLIMALTVPIILASHISGWKTIPAFSLRAMYVGMFWLFALHVFFRCAPPWCWRAA